MQDAAAGLRAWSPRASAFVETPKAEETFGKLLGKAKRDV